MNIHTLINSFNIDAKWCYPRPMNKYLMDVYSHGVTTMVGGLLKEIGIYD